MSESGATEKSEKRRRMNAERSAYFARREAAKVLRVVLLGDARRQAVGSIKSLVYSPSVKNKKGTFALVCQTLKHLLIIKEVLEAASVLNSKWKKQEELIYVITYDILFGQAVLSTGDAEKFLWGRRDALKSALASLLKRKQVKSVQELVSLYETPGVSKPRYVRVNTLKVDVESAVLELEKQYMVQKDDLVPDLLVLPPGSDLHDHHLVMNGSIFMQGKASSMVAAALSPKPGWEVLDACSAPGNKTVQLAAIMRGKGKILACELNKERVKRLKDTIRLSGASNIQVLHGDFLKLSSVDPSYSKVRAILLDPSCSGSGTASVRLDHLLPSYASGHSANAADEERLKKLAAFQRKALEHALSFPGVQRIVYSTCSVHQIENEDVVQSVLPLAASYGFHLETPFPQWQRRGLPVFDGSENLLRTDPVEDKEGFFIALFVRKISDTIQDSVIATKKQFMVRPSPSKLFKFWLKVKPNWGKRLSSRRKRCKTVK
ncbi:25S rRNA (cytosine-C(5))-methyltransferase NSUN5 isoform X1 [Ziziphus jujuba]|uniref:25S rRNA (Cytosine-C(5))-methyltransferase NSUN5 isoform X1 n=1 Tax=Ziziphus jujuba TaxID=326968 RepID=A0A6P4AFM6_ZIZJJ|nr:25S rRNA (cytosine-C(5))-methyltransferase NSUN5 isoform X1 [Ziziphus jujuba]